MIRVFYENPRLLEYTAILLELQVLEVDVSAFFYIVTTEICRFVSCWDDTRKLCVNKIKKNLVKTGMQHQNPYLLPLSLAQGLR